MTPKKILRQTLINLAALFLTKFIVSGMTIPSDYKTLLIASLALTGINLLIKPVLKLLFLPINILTLGLLRWLVNVTALYLLTIIVSQIKIVGFYFTGFSFGGFIIPQLYISTFIAYVLCSLVISGISTFVNWLSC